MQIKIESDIEIPRRKARGTLEDRSYRQYPWRDMEIGQSFFIKSDHPRDGAHAIRSAASYFSARNPEYKFTIRIVKERRPELGIDERGTRVWRVDPDGNDR